MIKCLAAVPYKTLREGVTCTCKSWRVLVASEAFKKTRVEQGGVGWAVFAGNLDQREMCYLLAPSGTYLTAPRPPDLANDDAHPQGPGMGLSAMLYDALGHGRERRQGRGRAAQ